MSSSTTNVGIRLSLQGAQEVESGLGRVQALAGDAAKTLAGLAAGTFSAAAFTAWIKGAIDAADETEELTQKTGLLTKEVAGLKLLFEQEGLGDAFGGTMAKLARQASEGNKAFAAMGVSVNGANGQLKSTRQLLGEVADRFAGYADGPEKAALAMELFGKSGADLIPLLNGGAKSLDDFDRKAEQLGLTLSTETAAAAAQFNDQLFLLSKNGQGVATAIASGLLPALVAVTEELAKGGQQGIVLASVSNGLATAFETASVLGLNVAYVLKQVGNELGGLAAQAAQVAQFNFSGAAEIGRMMRADAEAARKEIDATSDRIVNARRRMSIGVISPDDQSAAEARRLGLTSGKGAAPALPDEAKAAAAARAAAGQKAAADRAAAAAARELAEARKRDFDVIKLRNEAAGKMWAEEQEAAQKAIDAMADLVELRQQAATGALDQLEAQRLANEEIGLEGVALVELQNARLLDAAAALERRAVLAQDIDFSGKMSEAYRQEAQGLRDLAAARTQGAQKQEAVDAAKAAAGEWQKTSDNIERSLTDALMRGFENGKSFGENLGDSVANYFKTSVANAIASAITKAIMSALASQQWGQVISGVFGGGGGGGMDWTSLATKAYQYYASTGSTAAVSAGAGTVNTTTLAGVSAASSGSTGVAGGGAAAASSGTASSTMTSGGFTGYGWMGYAALIAAAVMVAENLYAKGYTRLAVGKGPGETNRFGYTQFTSDPNMGNSTAYNISPENRSRMIFDSLGMNDKWADILSGTVRMGTLFGRKLGAYGYEAQIGGGDAEVSGFARYKGGLFRSNKTVGIEIDQRDAAAIDAMVEAQIEGSRNMARAMGLSSEAIDAYTGSIRINMKGAKTAEEQAKRAAEAMDNLNYELLKTASGGKLAREDFKTFMEGIQKDVQQAGISAEGMADILVQGMTGRLSGADVGAQLSDMLLGGIYNAIASSAAGQISQLFMTQIITPIFTAIASGVPLSQAVSAAAMKQTVETARQYMATVSAIFNDPEFQAWVTEFKGSLNKLGGEAAKVAAPRMRTYSTGPSAAQLAAEEAKRQRDQLEKELLRLQGNTVELRRRELLELHPTNRALQEQIWRLEDIRETWTEVMDAISGEMKSLRDELLGESEAARAAAMSEFTIATAAARAGDATAANQLPELARAVADMAKATAGTLAQQQYTLAYVFNSLDQTRSVLNSKYGIEIPKFAEGGHHSGGLRLVGERGAELEVTGPARYWNAQQTSQMLSGGREMADAISKLADRMASLEDRVGLVVVNTGSAARTLSDMQSEQQFVGASS